MDFSNGLGVPVSIFCHFSISLENLSEYHPGGGTGIDTEAGRLGERGGSSGFGGDRLLQPEVAAISSKASEARLFKFLGMFFLLLCPTVLPFRLFEAYGFRLG